MTSGYLHFLPDYTLPATVADQLTGWQCSVQPYSAVCQVAVLTYCIVRLSSHNDNRLGDFCVLITQGKHLKKFYTYPKLQFLSFEWAWACRMDPSVKRFPYKCEIKASTIWSHAYNRMIDCHMCMQNGNVCSLLLPSSVQSWLYYHYSCWPSQPHQKSIKSGGVCSIGWLVTKPNQT